MSISKLTFALSTLGIGLAMAASDHTVTLTDPAWVGQTELKAGQYKVAVENGKAVFKSGKNTVEIPATVESSGKKFEDTSLETAGSKLQKIHLGGSNTTIVFPTEAPATTPVGNGNGS